MNVSPQYVADHYDEVAAAVTSGEVVEVSLPEKPALRLVWSSDYEDAGRTEFRVLGAGKAFAPLLSQEELEQVDREWKRDVEEKMIG